MPDMPGNIEQLSPTKRAFLELRDLRSKIRKLEQARSEQIAIISADAQFPGGANDLESFWRTLEEGIDAIGDVPADRWNIADYFDSDPDAPGKMHARQGGFIDNVHSFDAELFGISPREALSMDPQHRLLLEVTWTALERAGQAPDKLSGSSTGVFIGLSTKDYFQHILTNEDDINAYFAIGNSWAAAVGRISYTFGLQGPAVSVDTACSSSLVAIHQACSALRNHECNMAIAGGVNLMLTPHLNIIVTKARMISGDGRCKTFDESADGYGRSEGCGIVILKRLSDAIADKDNIMAVIRGTAINQDGRSNGITAPNGPSQEAVIRQALANARLKPEQVSYIEAHGTGTPLGDPIEVHALASVLGPSHSKDNPLMIGSVKTNIGHLESAAGVAGLLKVLLALQHEKIPGNLHFRKPNPFIEWDEIPIKVLGQHAQWPRGEKPRIAGLSSFGFAGTNVHMLIEEAPVPEAESGQDENQLADRPLNILTLSVKKKEALVALADRYESFLAQRDGEIALRDICFTANAGRADLEERLSIVCKSKEDLREKLKNLTTGHPASGVFTGRVNGVEPPGVAFLFTGQGSQYPGMGHQLYQTQPVFRAAMDECALLLEPYLKNPLLSVIYGDNETSDLINQTVYTQPALFALEYSLAQLWRSWGIEPSLVLGHSVGEYVAACVAGVFSLEDGLKLIAERGRLMQDLPPGGVMAAVFADEVTVSRAAESYGKTVSIAAANGPENIVISGVQADVETILKALESQGVKSRRLTVSHAFHSPLMEPMLAAFGQVAAAVTYNEPQIDLISNVSGKLAGTEIASPDYWQRHVKACVRFADAMQELAKQKCDLLIEVGPKPTLLSMGQLCLPGFKGTWLPSLQKGKDDWQQILESLGTCYIHGSEIDWIGYEQGHSRKIAGLPTYPFQRERYWFEVSESSGRSGNYHSRAGVHPLLGEQLSSPALAETVFESYLGSDFPSYLDDHRIAGIPLLPTTAYLEMAVAVADQMSGSGALALENVVFKEALVFGPGNASRVQVTLNSVDDGGKFRIFSMADSDEKKWRLHTEGHIRSKKTSGAHNRKVSLDEMRKLFSKQVSVKAYYDQLAQSGMDYGPAFQGVCELWRRENEAFGRAELPAEIAPTAEKYHIHPALLDACFQITGAAIEIDADNPALAPVYIPDKMASFDVLQSHRASVWVHARIRFLNEGRPAGPVAADLSLFDEDGALVAEILDLHLNPIKRETLAEVLRMQLPDDVAMGQAAESERLEGQSAAERSIDREKFLASTHDEKQQIVQRYLQGRLAEVLGHASGQVDINKPMDRLGLDSLMAVQLRNRIEVDLSVDIPASKFLQGHNTIELAAMILAGVVGATNGEKDTSSENGEPDTPGTNHDLTQADSADLLARMDELSDEEIDLLLQSKLGEQEKDL